MTKTTKWWCSRFLNFCVVFLIVIIVDVLNPTLTLWPKVFAVVGFIFATRMDRYREKINE